MKKDGERKEAHCVEHLLEEEFVCSSLVCKERARLLCTRQQSKHHYCLDGKTWKTQMEKTIPVFFFFEDPKPSITEKVARVLAQSKRRHVSLFESYLYIYIYIFIMWSPTVSEEDPGR
jgi:hypothetical protein